MITLFVIAVCLILNGFFSALEMAFVSVRRSELLQRSRAGDHRAEKLLRLRNNPERALSILQIGITLVGSISAAVGASGAIEVLAPKLVEEFGLRRSLAEALVVALVVLPLTYLNVVVGELVPKALALRNAAKISMFGASWLTLMDRIFRPVIAVLEASTKLIIRIFFPGASQNASNLALTDADNLAARLSDGIKGVSHIEKKPIHDFIVPWTATVKISVMHGLEEVMKEVFTSGHTRLPVVNEDETVRGILHTKEFLSYRESGGEDWLSIVRSVVEIDANAKALKAFRSMQEKHSHLAVVYFKGQILGIVTLEDILEELVGDIFDEDDDGRMRRHFIREMED